MPGPKPKSARERELQGNPGHKKKDSSKASAPGLDVKPADAPVLHDDAPAELSPLARRAWNTAAPALRRIGMLREPDSNAFARYCAWLARYMELEKASRRGKASKIVETTKSRAVTMQRLGKSFQAMLMIDKRLMEYEDRFGMNPRDRQAIMAKLAGGNAPPPEPPRPTGDAPARRESPIGILAQGTSRVQ